MTHDVMASKPIAVDSRIKIYLYNEYEVYNLTFHYGHHGHIDFAKGEVVQSIIMGNEANWTVEPRDSRLFIKAHEKDLYTNMTVITNRRAYEFDIMSKDAGDVEDVDRDLVYVAKFFYPDDHRDQDNAKQSAANLATNNAAAGQQRKAKADSQPLAPPLNRMYSFVGERSLVPMEVFDDGVAVYMRFGDSKSRPKEIFYQDDHKKEIPLDIYEYKGYTVVMNTAPKLILKFGGKKIVYLFNES